MDKQRVAAELVKLAKSLSAKRPKVGEFMSVDLMAVAEVISRQVQQALRKDDIRLGKFVLSTGSDGVRGSFFTDDGEQKFIMVDLLYLSGSSNISAELHVGSFRDTIIVDANDDISDISDRVVKSVSFVSK